MKKGTQTPLMNTTPFMQTQSMQTESMQTESMQTQWMQTPLMQTIQTTFCCRKLEITMLVYQYTGCRLPPIFCYLLYLYLTWVTVLFGNYIIVGQVIYKLCLMVNLEDVIPVEIITLFANTFNILMLLSMFSEIKYYVKSLLCRCM